MQNWKKYTLAVFMIFSAMIVFGVTNPRFSNQREKITVTTPRLSTIDATNLPTFTEKFTELRTEILLPSDLPSTKSLPLGQPFKASYRGWLAANAEIFDQNISTDGVNGVIEFNPNSLIQGFSQGVAGMQIGEVRRIFIPSELGYGESASDTIPANSDLIFDVELISF